jgi:hypothetical protein
VQVQGDTVPCAVLSQCCDVDPQQKPAPHSFFLCELIPVPEGIRQRPERHQLLTANLDPYGGQRAFFQLFWLGTVPGLTGEFVADFAQVMTVSWPDYKHTVAGKIAELDDLHRAKFRVKAGAHFGRVTAEDLGAGLADPYRHPDSGPPPKPLYAEKVKQALRLIMNRE